MATYKTVSSKHRWLNKLLLLLACGFILVAIAVFISECFPKRLIKNEIEALAKAEPKLVEHCKLLRLNRKDYVFNTAIYYEHKDNHFDGRDEGWNIYYRYTKNPDNCYSVSFFVEIDGRTTLGVSPYEFSPFSANACYKKFDFLYTS